MTMEYGGKSEKDWTEIEIWDVPDGGVSSKPGVRTGRSAHRIQDMSSLDETWTSTESPSGR